MQATTRTFSPRMRGTSSGRGTTLATKVQKQELDEVWREYKKTHEEKLRNRLIESYVPLVRYAAERLQSRLPQTVETDDLASAGVFGLMDAIDKFDMNRGVKFETYCMNRIRGAMLDELRSLDWVPRLVRTRSHGLERAYAALEARLGRTPTDVELSNEMGIGLKDFDTLIKEVSVASMLSLNRKLQESGDDAEHEGVEMVEDRKEVDPVRELQKKELVEFITKGLSKKDRLVLLLYYYEELTMKEIGQTLDLSESRVCQIHARLMMRLKAQLSRIRSELMT